MKLSELKKQIKDNIYEILSEENTSITEAGEKTAMVTFRSGKTSMVEYKDDKELQKFKDNPDVQSIVTSDDRKLKEEEDEDREPTKAELEKEKVKGAPSKFKVSQDDFEDFKTKLKTLVKKIKDMEKGEERTKKMAALKQFIKKPELVKAFKERDVQIDTGDLVG
jgi:hypothetical protein